MLTLVVARTQAWERLSDPEYAGKLGMGEFKELLLKAGYSEDVAQGAAKQRGWDRLCAEVTL